MFLALVAFSEPQAGYPARTAPAGMLTDAAQIAAGKILFREKCASCHGHPDEGRSPRADFFQPPAPDFTERLYRDSAPAFLYWRIEIGKTVEPYAGQGSVMPAWGASFKESEIWQLVAYLQVRAS